MTFFLSPQICWLPVASQFLISGWLASCEDFVDVHISSCEDFINERVAMYKNNPTIFHYCTKAIDYINSRSYLVGTLDLYSASKLESCKVEHSYIPSVFNPYLFTMRWVSKLLWYLTTSLFFLIALLTRKKHPILYLLINKHYKKMLWKIVSWLEPNELHSVNLTMKIQSEALLNPISISWLYFLCDESLNYTEENSFPARTQ